MISSIALALLIHFVLLGRRHLILWRVLIVKPLVCAVAPLVHLPVVPLNVLALLVANRWRLVEDLGLEPLGARWLSGAAAAAAAVARVEAVSNYPRR